MKVIVVGTGRVGTRSMRAFLQQLLETNGIDGGAQDHSSHDTLVHASIERVRLGLPAHPDAMNALRQWTHAAEVGPMLGLLLPEILAVFGPGVPIIHLIREDRDAFIASAIKRPLKNPQNWGNYVDCDGEFALYRPTAVHFGEMSENEWTALSLEEKLGWMYDMHRRETERMLPSFEKTMTVRTEALNDLDTKQAVAEFLGLSLPADISMPWFNRFRDASYAGLSAEQIRDFENAFQFFDWNRVARDPDYPLSHFLNQALNRLKDDPDRKELRQSLVAHFESLRDALNDD